MSDVAYCNFCCKQLQLAVQRALMLQRETQTFLPQLTMQTSLCPGISKYAQSILTALAASAPVNMLIMSSYVAIYLQH